MASNESEAGRPSRKGKASLRATEAGFQITDSPASSRQEKKQDGGCPRRSAAAAPESLSFADLVERRQADIVRLDGEEEGDEEEEGVAEEVGDKQQGSGKGGEGLPSAQTASTLAAQGLKDLEHGPEGSHPHPR